MNKALLSAVLFGIISAGDAGLAARADDQAAQVDQALERAAAELAGAQEAGHVWRLIDPAAGSGSQDLDKLLEVAKAKQTAGELDEALRLANRIADAAALGQAQAESQAGGVAPHYPE